MYYCGKNEISQHVQITFIPLNICIITILHQFIEWVSILCINVCMATSALKWIIMEALTYINDSKWKITIYQEIYEQQKIKTSSYCYWKYL